MTVFAVDIGNRKNPSILRGCATIEEAELVGEASDTKDYTVVSLQKLGDSFNGPELVALFNNLPGEAKVERFSDKATAVERIMAKYHECAEELNANGKKKAKRKSNGTTKRGRATVTGKISAVKNEDKRWNKGSPRSTAYFWLLEEGAMPVEDFIAGVMKKQKLERKQVLGIITKLLGTESVKVS